jgi:hypothetical protein
MPTGFPVTVAYPLILAKREEAVLAPENLQAPLPVTESAFHGLQVGAVTIAGELHPIGEAGRQVFDKDLAL